MYIEEMYILTFWLQKPQLSPLTSGVDFEPVRNIFRVRRKKVKTQNINDYNLALGKLYTRSLVRVQSMCLTDKREETLSKLKTATKRLTCEKQKTFSIFKLLFFS